MSTAYDSKRSNRNDEGDNVGEPAISAHEWRGDKEKRKEFASRVNQFLSQSGDSQGLEEIDKKLPDKDEVIAMLKQTLAKPNPYEKFVSEELANGPSHLQAGRESYWEGKEPAKERILTAVPSGPRPRPWTRDQIDDSSTLGKALSPADSRGNWYSTGTRVPSYGTADQQVQYQETADYDSPTYYMTLGSQPDSAGGGGERFPRHIDDSPVPSQNPKNITTIGNTYDDRKASGGGERQPRTNNFPNYNKKYENRDDSTIQYNDTKMIRRQYSDAKRPLMSNLPNRIEAMNIEQGINSSVAQYFVQEEGLGYRKATREMVTYVNQEEPDEQEELRYSLRNGRNISDPDRPKLYTATITYYHNYNEDFPDKKLQPGQRYIQDSRLAALPDISDSTMRKVEDSTQTTGPIEDYYDHGGKAGRQNVYNYPVAGAATATGTPIYATTLKGRKGSDDDAKYLGSSVDSGYLGGRGNMSPPLSPGSDPTSPVRTSPGDVNALHHYYSDGKTMYHDMYGPIKSAQAGSGTGGYQSSQRDRPLNHARSLDYPTYDPRGPTGARDQDVGRGTATIESVGRQRNTGSPYSPENAAYRPSGDNRDSGPNSVRLIGSGDDYGSKALRRVPSDQWRSQTPDAGTFVAPAQSRFPETEKNGAGRGYRSLSPPNERSAGRDPRDQRTQFVAPPPLNPSFTDSSRGVQGGIQGVRDKPARPTSPPAGIAILGRSPADRGPRSVSPYPEGVYGISGPRPDANFSDRIAPSGNVTMISSPTDSSGLRIISPEQERYNQSGRQGDAFSQPRYGTTTQGTYHPSGYTARGDGSGTTPGASSFSRGKDIDLYGAPGQSQYPSRDENGVGGENFRARSPSIKDKITDSFQHIKQKIVGTPHDSTTTAPKTAHGDEQPSVKDKISEGIQGAKEKVMAPFVGGTYHTNEQRPMTAPDEGGLKRQGSVKDKIADGWHDFKDKVKGEPRSPHEASHHPRDAKVHPIDDELGYDNEKGLLRRKPSFKEKIEETFKDVKEKIKAPFTDAHDGGVSHVDHATSGDLRLVDHGTKSRLTRKDSYEKFKYEHQPGHSGTTNTRLIGAAAIPAGALATGALVTSVRRDPEDNRLYSEWDRQQGDQPPNRLDRDAYETSQPGGQHVTFDRGPDYHITGGSVPRTSLKDRIVDSVGEIKDKIKAPFSHDDTPGTHHTGWGKGKGDYSNVADSKYPSSHTYGYDDGRQPIGDRMYNPSSSESNNVRLIGAGAVPAGALAAGVYGSSLRQDPEDSRLFSEWDKGQSDQPPNRIYREAYETSSGGHHVDHLTGGSAPRTSLKDRIADSVGEIKDKIKAPFSHDDTPGTHHTGWGKGKGDHSNVTDSKYPSSHTYGYEDGRRPIGDRIYNPNSSESNVRLIGAGAVPAGALAAGVYGSSLRQGPEDSRLFSEWDKDQSEQPHNRVYCEAYETSSGVHHADHLTGGSVPRTSLKDRIADSVGEIKDKIKAPFSHEDTTGTHHTGWGKGKEDHSNVADSKYPSSHTYGYDDGRRPIGERIHSPNSSEPSNIRLIGAGAVPAGALAVGAYGSSLKQDPEDNRLFSEWDKDQSDQPPNRIYREAYETSSGGHHADHLTGGSALRTSLKDRISDSVGEIKDKIKAPFSHDDTPGTYHTGWSKGKGDHSNADGSSYPKNSHTFGHDDGKRTIGEKISDSVKDTKHKLIGDDDNHINSTKPRKSLKDKFNETFDNIENKIMAPFVGGKDSHPKTDLPLSGSQESHLITPGYVNAHTKDGTGIDRRGIDGTPFVAAGVAGAAAAGAYAIDRSRGLGSSQDPDAFRPRKESIKDKISEGWNEFKDKVTGHGADHPNTARSNEPVTRNLGRDDHILPVSSGYSGTRYIAHPGGIGGIDDGDEKVFSRWDESRDDQPPNRMYIDAHTDSIASPQSPTYIAGYGTTERESFKDKLDTSIKATKDKVTGIFKHDDAHVDHDVPLDRRNVDNVHGGRESLKDKISDSFDGIKEKIKAPFSGSHGTAVPSGKVSESYGHRTPSLTDKIAGTMAGIKDKVTDPFTDHSGDYYKEYHHQAGTPYNTGRTDVTTLNVDDRGGGNLNKIAGTESYDRDGRRHPNQPYSATGVSGGRYNQDPSYNVPSTASYYPSSTNNANADKYSYTDGKNRYASAAPYSTGGTGETGGFQSSRYPASRQLGYAPTTSTSRGQSIEGQVGGVTLSTTLDDGNLPYTQKVGIAPQFYHPRYDEYGDFPLKYPIKSKSRDQSRESQKGVEESGISKSASPGNIVGYSEGSRQPGDQRYGTANEPYGVRDVHGQGFPSSLSVIQQQGSGSSSQREPSGAYNIREDSSRSRYIPGQSGPSVNILEKDQRSRDLGKIDRSEGVGRSGTGGTTGSSYPISGYSPFVRPYATDQGRSTIDSSRISQRNVTGSRGGTDGYYGDQRDSPSVNVVARDDQDNLNKIDGGDKSRGTGGRYDKYKSAQTLDIYDTSDSGRVGGGGVSGARDFSRSAASGDRYSTGQGQSSRGYPVSVNTGYSNVDDRPYYSSSTSRYGGDTSPSRTNVSSSQRSDTRQVGSYGYSDTNPSVSTYPTNDYETSLRLLNNRGTDDPDRGDIVRRESSKAHRDYVRNNTRSVSPTRARAAGAGLSFDMVDYPHFVVVDRRLESTAPATYTDDFGVKDDFYKMVLAGKYNDPDSAFPNMKYLPDDESSRIPRTTSVSSFFGSSSLSRGTTSGSTRYETGIAVRPGLADDDDYYSKSYTGDRGIMTSSAGNRTGRDDSYKTDRPIPSTGDYYKEYRADDKAYSPTAIKQDFKDGRTSSTDYYDNTSTTSSKYPAYREASGVAAIDDSSVARNRSSGKDASDIADKDHYRLDYGDRKITSTDDGTTAKDVGKGKSSDTTTGNTWSFPTWFKGKDKAGDKKDDLRDDYDRSAEGPDRTNSTIKSREESVINKSGGINIRPYVPASIADRGVPSTVGEDAKIYLEPSRSADLDSSKSTEWNQRQQVDERSPDHIKLLTPDDRHTELYQRSEEDTLRNLPNQGRTDYTTELVDQIFNRDIPKSLDKGRDNIYQPSTAARTTEETSSKGTYPISERFKGETPTTYGAIVTRPSSSIILSPSPQQEAVTEYKKSGGVQEGIQSLGDDDKTKKGDKKKSKKFLNRLRESFTFDRDQPKTTSLGSESIISTPKSAIPLTDDVALNKSSYDTKDSTVKLLSTTPISEVTSKEASSISSFTQSTPIKPIRTEEGKRDRDIGGGVGLQPSMTGIFLTKSPAISSRKPDGSDISKGFGSVEVPTDDRFQYRDASGDLYSNLKDPYMQDSIFQENMREKMAQQPNQKFEIMTGKDLQGAKSHGSYKNLAAYSQEGPNASFLKGEGTPTESTINDRSAKMPNKFNLDKWTEPGKLIDDKYTYYDPADRNARDLNLQDSKFFEELTPSEAERYKNQLGNYKNDFTAETSQTKPTSYKLNPRGQETKSYISPEYQDNKNESYDGREPIKEDPIERSLHRSCPCNGPHPHKLEDHYKYAEGLPAKDKLQASSNQEAVTTTPSTVSAAILKTSLPHIKAKETNQGATDYEMATGHLDTARNSLVQENLNISTPETPRKSTDRSGKKSIDKGGKKISNIKNNFKSLFGVGSVDKTTYDYSTSSTPATLTTTTATPIIPKTSDLEGLELRGNEYAEDIVDDTKSEISRIAANTDKANAISTAASSTISSPLSSSNKNIPPTTHNVHFDSYGRKSFTAEPESFKTYPHTRDASGAVDDDASDYEKVAPVGSYDVVGTEPEGEDTFQRVKRKVDGAGEKVKDSVEIVIGGVLGGGATALTTLKRPVAQGDTVDLNRDAAITDDKNYLADKDKKVKDKNLFSKMFKSNTTSTASSPITSPSQTSYNRDIPTTSHHNVHFDSYGRKSFTADPESIQPFSRAPETSGAIDEDVSEYEKVAPVGSYDVVGSEEGKEDSFQRVKRKVDDAGEKIKDSVGTAIGGTLGAGAATLAALKKPIGDDTIDANRDTSIKDDLNYLADKDKKVKKKNSFSKIFSKGYSDAKKKIFDSKDDKSKIDEEKVSTEGGLNQGTTSNLRDKNFEDDDDIKEGTTSKNTDLKIGGTRYTVPSPFAASATTSPLKSALKSPKGGATYDDIVNQGSKYMASVAASGSHPISELTHTTVGSTSDVLDERSLPSSNIKYKSASYDKEQTLGNVSSKTSGPKVIVGRDNNGSPQTIESDSAYHTTNHKNVGHESYYGDDTDLGGAKGSTTPGSGDRGSKARSSFLYDQFSDNTESDIDDRPPMVGSGDLFAKPIRTRHITKGDTGYDTEDKGDNGEYGDRSRNSSLESPIHGLGSTERDNVPLRKGKERSEYAPGTSGGAAQGVTLSEADMMKAEEFKNDTKRKKKGFWLFDLLTGHMLDDKDNYYYNTDKNKGDFPINEHYNRYLVKAKEEAAQSAVPAPEDDIIYRSYEGDINKVGTSTISKTPPRSVDAEYYPDSKVVTGSSSMVGKGSKKKHIT